jgi:hypothetical protein
MLKMSNNTGHTLLSPSLCAMIKKQTQIEERSL